MTTAVLCSTWLGRSNRCALHSALNRVIICFVLALAAHKLLAGIPVPQDPNRQLPAPTTAAPAAIPSGANDRAQRPNQTGPPSTPSEGKALIYVYSRGSWFSPMIFVNDYPVAALRDKRTYAFVEMPPGRVLITSVDSPGFDLATFRQIFPPKLRWPQCSAKGKATCTWDAATQVPEEGARGCTRLDWGHLDGARSEDVGVCKSELFNTATALQKWLDPHWNPMGGMAGAFLEGLAGDQSGWLRTCGPNPFGKPSKEAAAKIRDDLKRGDTSDEWSRCVNAVAAASSMLNSKDRLPIDVEAGKTYYIQWAPTRGGKVKYLKAVDAAKAAKDMQGFHPTDQQ